ncbi:hypothetical protein URH17368_2574 [Alicyclobacillus hesperidum URH17-3-68]|nr:hypothetical protein URH17368_2574 [Alicyclobacillus hesperidum URH17-3-68]
MTTQFDVRAVLANSSLDNPSFITLQLIQQNCAKSEDWE